MLSTGTTQTQPPGTLSHNNDTGQETLEISARDWVHRLLTSEAGTERFKIGNNRSEDTRAHRFSNQSATDTQQPFELFGSNVCEYPQTCLHALQEWEGYIVNIYADSFVARLVDITADDDYETEEVTIPFEELSSEDAEKVELGRFFRWVIGYERSASGAKRMVSRVVFRNLPRITQRDVEKANAWAERMAAFLNG